MLPANVVTSRAALARRTLLTLLLIGSPAGLAASQTTTAPAQTTTAPAPPAQPAPPAPKEEKPHWTGSIIGAPLLLQEYGVTDQTTVMLNGSLELVEPVVAYAIDGEYTFSKIKFEGVDQTVLDAQRLSMTVRHSLTKRTYIAFRPAYKRNKVQSIDYEVEELFGYGIILAENKHGSLHVVPIIGATQQQKNVPAIDGGTGTAGVLQIAGFKLGQVWRFQQTFLFMQNFKDGDDYRSRFSTELQGKVYGPLTIQIKFSNDRDNIVADTEEKAVRQFTLGVGLSFR